MKLISRNTDYAVRAVCYMARKNKDTVSAYELVKTLKIPRPFLRKILQALHKKGLLESYKGVGGGFRLARKPGKIYLVDLIEVFQGPIKLNECLFKKEICPNQRSCFLKRKIDAIEDYVILELKKITVESVIKGK